MKTSILLFFSAISALAAGIQHTPVAVAPTPASLYAITGTHYASKVTLTAINDSSLNTVTYVGDSFINVPSISGVGVFGHVGAIIQPASTGAQPDSLTFGTQSGASDIDLSSVYVMGAGSTLSAVIENPASSGGGTALSWAGTLANASSTAPVCRALQNVTIVSKVPGQTGKTFVGDGNLSSYSLSDTTFNTLPNGLPVARVLNPFTGSGYNTHVDRWDFRMPHGTPTGQAGGNYCVFNQFDSYGEYSLGLEFTGPADLTNYQGGAVKVFHPGFSGELISLSTGTTAISIPYSGRITYPAGQTGKVFLGASSMNTSTGAGVYHDLPAEYDVFDLNPNGYQFGGAAGCAVIGHPVQWTGVYAYANHGPALYASPSSSGLVIAVEKNTQDTPYPCNSVSASYYYNLASYTASFGTSATATASGNAYVEEVNYSIRAGQYGMHHVNNSIGEVQELRNTTSTGVPAEVFTLHAPAPAPFNSQPLFNLNGLTVSSDYASQQLSIYAGWSASSSSTTPPSTASKTMVPVVGGQISSSTYSPVAVLGSGAVDYSTYTVLPGNYVKTGLFGTAATTQPDSTYTGLGVLFWPNTGVTSDNWAQSQKFTLGTSFTGTNGLIGGYATNQGLLVGGWQVQ